MGLFVQMNALASHRPHTGASNAEIAAWYMAKARLHECLAREPGANAGEELAKAAVAYTRGQQYWHADERESGVCGAD